MIGALAWPATALGWADAAALALFFVAVLGVTWRVERPAPARPSLARLMAAQRMRWMREMAARDTRIVDAQLLNIQHRGAGFFASAAMIAIGGVAAAIGAAEEVLGLAGDFAAPAAASDRAIVELKLLFLALTLALALLKFVWAHRLYGYCAILIGATPPVGAPESAPMAERAGAFNVSAGRSFNRGLRLVYFSLAALGWLLGPAAFAAATLATVAMLYRREFLSQTRRLLEPGGDAEPLRTAP